MSRIGKQPIPLPTGVSVSLDPGRVMVAGPLGTLQQSVPQRIAIEQTDLSPEQMESAGQIHGTG